MADFLRTAIPFLLSNFTLTFLVIGLIFSAVALMRSPESRTPAGIVEKLISWFVFFSVGIENIYNFVAHVFFGEIAARFIGWADSPFQTELGFASLGFALVGFIAWRGSYGMRVAAVLGPAVFLLGAAGGHIYQIMTTGNHAAGNSGLLLWMDVVIPLAGLLFLAIGRPPTATASAAAGLAGARR